MTSELIEVLLEKDLVELRGGKAIGNSVASTCRCPSGAGQSAVAGDGECICDNGGAGQQLKNTEKPNPGCRCLTGGAAV